MADGFASSLARQGLRLFEPRVARAVVAALLLVYAIGFALFYPATITVADEGTYVRQAQFILQGSTAVEVVDPFTGRPVELHPFSSYPLGTALFLLPFVALGGRAAASVMAMLCTVAGVAATARLLREQGRSPLWALLVLAFPPAIVMGRVAMSEAPSLLVVALGLLFFFRGVTGRRGAFLAAGFAAGFSFALRETNVLVFAPFFAGSVFRRDPGWPVLALGGALGLSIRAVSAWIFFGDPFFAKPPDPFSLLAVAENAPTYLFALLVLVPGGLVAAAAYRGLRRPEICAAIFGFALVYAAYEYSGEASGWAKRLVLGPRYFIPLLPLLALTAAEVWPRFARAARSRLSQRAAAAAETGLGLACLASVLALACALVGVQVAHAAWANEQARVREAIYGHTEEDSVVVTNWSATGKFIDLVEGRRVVLRRDHLGAAHVRRILDVKGSFYVVLLDRSDSDFWRRNAWENQLFVAQLGDAAELLLDLEVTPTDRLRIWRVSD